MTEQATKAIPVMRPQLPAAKNVVPYLERMDSARIYSNRGPLVQEYEQRLAARLNISADQLVVCSSATVALVGAIAQMPTDKVAVPTFTFPASATSVIHAGKTLALLDINEQTWQLDRGLVQPEMGTVTVMPFGNPLDVSGWEGIEWLVIDAAASFGSDGFDQLQALPPTWAVVYSLHATKVLGIGEGGIAIFGDPDRARKFRAWINFGFDGTRDSALPGTNGKMSEIAAAYGMAVLDQADEELSEWEEVHAWAAHVGQELGCNPQAIDVAAASPYWIAEFADSAECSQVEAVLQERQIATRRWWSMGCHRMPAFRDFCGGQNYAVAEAVAGRTLGLPMYRDLTKSDIDWIAESVAAAR